MKALLVCALSLAMAIPALFFFALLQDRTNRADQVVAEVSQVRGGEQTFMGPVIAVPYTAGSGQMTERGVYYIYADTGTVNATVKTETLKRSLFVVPVYESTVQLSAVFNLKTLEIARPDLRLDWSGAEILVGASDLRGARGTATIAIDGVDHKLRPAGGGTPGPVMPMARGGAVAEASAAYGPVTIGRPDYMAPFALMAAPLGRKPDTLNAMASLTFTGAKTLRFVPFAKETTAHVVGDWPAPSFQGAFLPLKRTLSATGFSADWTIPFVARGLAEAEPNEGLNKLGPVAFDIGFARTDDPYKSVGRSLKYALLFLGLVFMTFFLFEAMSKKRVHAAQYVLIGLAQLVFYLLLLSIAEHLGFDMAFVIASSATVSLIAAYAGWTFDSRAKGWAAFGLFGGLYALIYVLMRLEDYALLVGSLVTFVAIAAAMILTRRLDWYGDTETNNG
jgi:inner membrane protein